MVSFAQSYGVGRNGWGDASLVFWKLTVDQKFSAFVFQKMYMDDLFPPRPPLTVFPHFINVVNPTIMYLLYSSLLSHDDRWT